MPGSFDAYQYIEYLRSRWKFIGVACAGAVLFSLAISLALPKKYSATARIVIEPPAASDARDAMAVSPIYLQSLKTYVLFASGDSLFLQAAERFGLRDSRKPQPIESLKRSVLKVELPRDTKVLEITATLRDPRKAQALAAYLAEQTVNLNRRVSADGDRELISDAEQHLSEARAQFEEIESSWKNLVASEPVDDLQTEIASAEGLRASLAQQLSSIDLFIADESDRQEGLSGGELDESRKELRSARVRAEKMSGQMAVLARQIAAKQALAGSRTANRDKLDAQRKAVHAAYQALETRLAETRAAAGYRSDRLKVIDPGIVPDRPSSPDIPLNVLAALVAGLTLSVLYSTLDFSYRVQRTGIRPVPLRVAQHD